MKAVIQKICLILFIAIFLSPVYSQSQNLKKVRVGYYENEIFQEGGKPGAVKTGYAYEYYQKISEYTGWKYEYVYGGYGDLYKLFLDGQIDLLAGLAYRQEREGLILYPNAAMGSETYNLVKHLEDDSITANYSTLNGKRIGVLDSAMVSVLETFLKNHNIKANIIKYPEHEHLFQDFDSRKIDILVAESDGTNGRDSAEVLYPIGTSEYYLCVSIKRPDLLEQLNTAQTQLFTEEPNFISTLRTKYYPVSISSRAFSNAEKNWIKNHTTLTVGYLDNYLPYSDTDSHGNPDGIITDIIPQIIERLGINHLDINYISFSSYEDMIKSMSQNTVDVIFPVGGGLYYSEENGIYQSIPVASSTTELVFNSEEFNPAHNMPETIAANKNNNMQYYYFLSNFPQTEIVFYPSIEDCLDSVLEGKTDCTTINGLRTEILKNRRYRKLSIRQLSASDDCCFGIEIGNEGLLKLLNRGLNVLGREYAQNLSSKYNSGLYTYSVTDFIFDNLLLFFVVILLIIAFIIILLVRDAKHSKKAMNAAESANKAKTVFLNNMSHDIRTPMNAIVGFTDLAKQNLDNKSLLKDYLNNITISSKHLLSLINDILDMSRIESGKVTVEKSKVNLKAFINDLQAIIEPSVSSKNQSFTLDISSIKNEFVITDKLRLNQILLNILTNAIKFTKPGGAISLIVKEQTADCKTSNFEFTIKDNGIGISEEFQKIIFVEFTRERTSTVSGIQGTGLGMAITKNIVDMLGGTIAVKSTEGVGSEFIVKLPFELCSEQGENQPQMQTVANFEGKRILLAEDNQMNQMIAQANLENLGLTVEIANDGVEAVQKVKENPENYYDLILMDIQMPNMDGYEAAKQIRALNSKKALVPIVAVTANAFEEDKKKVLDCGMNAHLAKPYDIPQIIKTLEKLLSP